MYGRRRRRETEIRMHPTLFEISFLPDWLADVKSYGLMMMIGFLTGIWDISTKKAEDILGYRLNPEEAREVFIQALKRDIALRKRNL